jgi:hypothetical protein
MKKLLLIPLLLMTIACEDGIPDNNTPTQKEWYEITDVDGGVVLRCLGSGQNRICYVKQ